VLQRFLYFVRETWNSLIRNWAMTVAGILTIAVSLLFLGFAILNNRRVDHGTERWKGNVGAEIFLRTDATELQKNDVQSALTADMGSGGTVRSYQYLSKKDALAEFKRLFHDDPDIANSVTDPNVLPESFKVKLRDASKVDTLIAEFNTKPGVDQVVTPTKAIKQKLDNARRTREILIVLALVLAVCAGVLIVNTIRLAIFARRREIEVMKLVGASNWFVRVPFMAEGLVQGIVGGLVAAGGVFLIKWGYYHFNFYEKGYFLGNGDAIFAGSIVLLLGAALGIFSSMFGLWRRLDV
jgi:cell division transport system permease protein